MMEHIIDTYGKDLNLDAVQFAGNKAFLAKYPAYEAKVRRTPLIMTATGRAVDSAALLLKKGAKPDAKETGKRAQSASEWAAQGDPSDPVDVEIAKVFGITLKER